MDYTKALAILHGRQSKKLANNTYLRDRGDGILAVQLHQTDVVTFRPDGSTTFNSGGWRTVTTKDRMNAFSPYNISQNGGIWHLTGHGETVVYFDGMTVKPGKPLPQDKKEEKRVKSLSLKIKNYARAYVDALLAGKIPAPSGGDCWHCCLKTVEGGVPMGDAFSDNSHLLEHLKEKYYVPSLIFNALEAIGAGDAWKWEVWQYMSGGKDHYFPDTAYFARTMRRFIVRYLKTRLAVGQ